MKFNCDQDSLCFRHRMKTRPMYTDDACRNTYICFYENCPLNLSSFKQNCIGLTVACKILQFLQTDSVDTLLNAIVP